MNGTIENVAYNSTMDIAYSAFGILPIVLLVLAGASIIAAVMILSSPAMLKRILKVREFLISTFGYFFYGTGALVIFGSFYFIFSLIGKDVGAGGNGIKAIVTVVLGFVGISTIGFLVKKLAVEKIMAAYNEAKEDNKDENTKT